jgi:hypothetical protein
MGDSKRFQRNISHSSSDNRKLETTRPVCSHLSPSESQTQRHTFILSQPSGSVTYRERRFGLETGFIYFAYNHNKLKSLKITSTTALHLQWHLNLNCFGADCLILLGSRIDFLRDRVELIRHSNCGSLQLRRLSSYWRTAKETHTSTSHVPLACALHWMCASTNRLPRNFHIGCCVSIGSLTGDLLNRYRRNAFSWALKNDRSVIPVFSRTRHNIIKALRGWVFSKRIFRHPNIRFAISWSTKHKDEFPCASYEIITDTASWNTTHWILKCIATVPTSYS